MTPKSRDSVKESKLLLKMDNIAGKSVLLWDLVVHLMNVSMVLIYFINIFPDKFMLVKPFNTC